MNTTKPYLLLLLAVLTLSCMSVHSQEPTRLRARLTQASNLSAEEAQFSSRLMNNSRRFQRELSGMQQTLNLSQSEVDYLSANRTSAIRLMAAMEFDASLDNAFVKSAVSNLANNLEVNLNDRYLAVASPDIPMEESENPEGLMNIQAPLFLEDCTEIELSFGITDSDQLSSDQPVNPLLIEAIQFAVGEANAVLEELKFPERIETVHISSTTNGLHGPNSNHYSGMAVDISRINGTRMYFKEGANRRLIFELQQAFNKFPYIRENFGPFLKYKYTLENQKWSYYHEVGGHKGHIHISVRK